MKPYRPVVGIFTLAVLGLVICLPGCNGDHDEGTSKRFDRVTISNMCSAPVDEATICIYDHENNPWWTVPENHPLTMGPNGEPVIVPLPTGASAGRSFRHDGEEDHKGATRVVCTAKVGNMVYTCTIQAEEGKYLNGASFWLNENLDGSGKVLTGTGVMSESHTRLCVCDPGQFGAPE